MIAWVSPESRDGNGGPPRDYAPPPPRCTPREIEECRAALLGSALALLRFSLGFSVLSIISLGAGCVLVLTGHHGASLAVLAGWPTFQAFARYAKKAARRAVQKNAHLSDFFP
jgi:hypothetical protein